jgi:hypothetical protein
MFNWLLPNRGKYTSVIGELAMRATIAYKLRKYNADEDITISEFSLADDEKKTKESGKLARVKKNDAWNQANPRETGKWKKENR